MKFQILEITGNYWVIKEKGETCNPSVLGRFDSIEVAESAILDFISAEHDVEL